MNTKEFLKEIGISDKKIESIINKVEVRDLETIKSKVDFLQKIFCCDEKEVVKIINRQPHVLGYNEDSVVSKMRFYKERFNLSKNQLVEFIKAYPLVLGKDTVSKDSSSVEGKISCLSKSLNISEDVAIDMIRQCPIILSIDIAQRVESILKISEKEKIIENPMILCASVKNLSEKYYLLLKGYSKDEILESRKLFTSLQKLYARSCFIEKVDKDFRKLTYGEKRFQKHYNVSSQELIEKYPVEEAEQE